MPMGAEQERAPGHRDGSRRWAATALAAAAVMGVGLVGCSRGGGTGGSGGGLPGLRTTTTAMDHGDGGAGHDDHGGGATPGGGTGGGGAPSGGHDGHGGGFDHPPTAEQKQRANKLIADTKASAQRQGLTTLAGIRAAGYISIGDEMTGTTHYVMPKYHYDGKELDPNAIESFAVRQGKPVAAMYILENGDTMANVPDVAGNWTMWHLHTLPFRSSNPRENGYYQLGGRYRRTTAPMLHVWLVDNPCGPFAGTDTTNMTGSCAPEAGH